MTRFEIYPQEAETLCRSLQIERSLTQKERDAIDDSDFAWPEEQKYPIDTQAHLDAAAKLIGRAPESVQAKIKKNAIRIAKRKKLSLPDSWTEDESSGKEDRTMMAAADPAPSTTADAPHPPMTGKHAHDHSHMDGYDHGHEHEHLNDNIHDHAHHSSISRAANHGPFTGTHTHAHPAMDSQGDDEMHEHEHSHDGDADHGHTHSEDRAALPTSALLYAPIVRIDKEKREVEGVATSEAVDSFGTIFSYDASKKAFQKWMDRTPNVREMHERKAAGKGIQVRFDDTARQIHVRTFVSRGAQDTWLKVEDGVLNGYSAGAINPVWDTVTRDGKKYPYLVSYDLTELSLVDRASNPDAQGLVLCRADGVLSDSVDVSEQEAPAGVGSLAPFPPSTIERAGARVSSGTRDAMHDSIGHTLKAAMSQMKNCGCDGCCSAMSMIDPDNDGDIDMGGYDDPDGDADQLYADKNQGDMDRAVTAALERVLPGVIERVLGPVYARQQQFLARIAQTPTYPEITIPSFDTAALEERLAAAIARVDSASSLSEVRDLLKSVKETVERVEAQPMPGGPVLNGARPVEKHLANDPRAYAAQGSDQASVKAVLDRLQASGALNSIEAQTAAASLMIQPMPGRRG
jgi:hypothetical protein